MTIRQDESSRLAIRLLGPLDVTVDGTQVTLGARRLRSVFLLLALSAGRPIPTDRLIDHLWDTEPPTGAVSTVHAYLSRLRRLLDRVTTRTMARTGLLRSTSLGHLLDVPPAAIDLHRFEQAALAGHTALTAGDPMTALGELRAGLALWRGPALPDLTSSIGDLHRTRLEGLRLAALADRLDAQAALGQDAETMPELQELVRRHPLDERFTGQLMTALYRSGRQADALAAYTRIRHRLDSELGVAPSPALSTLNAKILEHSAALRPARRADRRGPVGGLIGLDRQLDTARDRPTEPSTRPSTGQTTRQEAVRLFRDRAAAVAPGFEVTSVNRNEIEQICDLLDTAPLAIELAAGRIGVLAPDQMLHRLRSAGPSRGLAALLRSGVLGLPDPATRLLGDLTVFAGGATPAAIEAVCGRPGDVGSVLADLQELTRAGLVVAAGPGHYTLLPGLRPGAAELLAAGPSDRYRSLRERHATFFARLVAPSTHCPDPADTPLRRAELEPEAAEVEAALRHAAGTRNGRLLIRLVNDLLGHWYATGRAQRADHWLEAACAAGSPAERAQLLLLAGRLTLIGADLDRAGLALVGAIEAAEAAGDDGLRAHGLALRSVAARFTGHPDQALALTEQAVQAARRAGAWGLVVRLGNERGELLDETGQSAAAESLFESFRAWSQVERSPGNQAVALVNLAGVVPAADRAAELLAEAAAVVGGTGSMLLRADVLAGSGAIHLRLGQTEAAVTALRAAVALMHRGGHLITLPDTVSLLGAAALAEGDRRAAVRLLATGHAWRRARRLVVVGRTTRQVLAEAERDLRRGGAGPHDAADRAAAAAVPFAQVSGILDGRYRTGPAVERQRPRSSFTGRSRTVTETVATIPRPGGRVTLPEGGAVAADSGP